MQSGFGMVQAKPSTSFSPVAVTPDELDPWWRDGRLHRRLVVHRNGVRIGQPQADDEGASIFGAIDHAVVRAPVAPHATL
jgi:fumarylacetoacetate (FAA) hydrolase